MTQPRWLAILAAALLLAGCAGGNGPMDTANDPAEPVNRGVYTFNDTLDTYALAPASRGWTAVTSAGVRDSVDNFFTNLETPGFVVNNLLQGKPVDAGRETLRFAINSTVGLVGLFDPAQAWFGLAGRREDFGQTLGVWGAEAGPYLVLPLFGPSGARDVTQYPVGWYTNALTYITLDSLTFGALTAVNVVNSRALAGDTARFRDDAAVDPYVFTRSAYRQYRQSQVHDGDVPLEADPYGDFFEGMKGDDEDTSTQP